MIKFIPVKTEDSRYAFVENLLHESFPEGERREDARQRYNVDNNPLFTTYLINDEEADISVGVITVWRFKKFCYVEHLATSPNIRNKGYGNKIIRTLLDGCKDITVVLEVELPEDEMSKRRIGFYERNGFRLCTKDYLQPPYRLGGKPIPMYLMFSGCESIDEDFENIKAEIYSNVYGV